MDDTSNVESTAARHFARRVDNPAPPADSALPDAPHPAVTGDADAPINASRYEQPGRIPVEATSSSVQTEHAVQRGNDNAPGTANGDKPTGWEAARERVMTDVATTPNSFATPPQSDLNSQGKNVKRAVSAVHGISNGDDTPTVKMEDSTPRPGRGRPRGRPRGKARGSGRGGKRKRDDDDDDDEGNSDSSDEVTPNATMTKSGRSVQKPTSFVPPPQSPTTNKRKRPYNRRNPESAVCKVCLRGTSPANNMIVFCDGCNAPYHRWCHKPPIDPAVVEEVDREWFCKQCESERVVPVPESEVANFISAEGASIEQRQKHFSSLPPGVLVTLLTKATSLHPDLPLFDPEFRPKKQAITQISAELSASTNNQDIVPTASASILPPPSQPDFAPSVRSHVTKNNTTGAKIDPDEKYTDEVHPANYPRPGQGLMSALPPEQNDLHYLVEDDKFGVFTHVYQRDPAAANTDVVGGSHRTNS